MLCVRHIECVIMGADPGRSQYYFELQRGKGGTMCEGRIADLIQQRASMKQRASHQTLETTERCAPEEPLGDGYPE